jgi:urease accessory protein
MNFMPRESIRTIAAQRAVGRLGLAFAQDGGLTRVQRFYQEGCLKARLPRAAVAGRCEAVTLNISGGGVGGDALHTSITLGAGARVGVASQAAERVYRALDAASAIETSVTLGAGAALDYFPQETILFDGFALRRSLEVELAADADFLGVESLVFGRRAMGEVVRSGFLRDRILLRRDGRLVLQDMTRLDGDIVGTLARKAVAGGAAAMASIIFAAPDAGAHLDVMRDVLNASGLVAGTSCFEGVVFARILAPDGASLRNCVVNALRACRNGREMPRVWQG